MVSSKALRLGLDASILAGVAFGSGVRVGFGDWVTIVLWW